MAREGVVLAGTADRGGGRRLLELEQGLLLFVGGIDVGTCGDSEAGRHTMKSCYSNHNHKEP